MRRSKRNQSGIVSGIWTLGLVLGLVLGLCLGKGTARAERLVTDLSEHVIEITSRFAGADLLIFGAIDPQIPQEDGGHGVVMAGMDYDVIISVSSATSDMTIRRKERISGIWVNKGRELLKGVPGYYSLGSTRPLEEILPEHVLEREQIGIERLPIKFASGLSGAEARAYREGFFRNMMQRGLYMQESGNVRLQEGILFRAEMHFPANMPVGEYLTRVYLVRDGEILLREDTTLQVDKVGLERAIYNFAHENPAAYGLAAVMMALFAGWLGGFLSQKVS